MKIATAKLLAGIKEGESQSHYFYLGWPQPRLSVNFLTWDVDLLSRPTPPPLYSLLGDTEIIRDAKTLI